MHSGSCFGPRFVCVVGGLGEKEKYWCVAGMRMAGLVKFRGSQRQHSLLKRDYNHAMTLGL